MENIITEASAVNWGLTLTILGALISVIVAGLGSSIACSRAGQKAAGVLAEKPHTLGKLIPLVALPGSQGIYGFLVAFLILFNIGALSGEIKALTFQNGLTFLLAGIIMAALGYASAVLQARSVCAGIGGLAKEESIGTGAIIMAAIVETYAIFGFLVALFILNSAMS
jgi:V/A-type H+-transporting ATPase subunit K